MRLDIRGVIAVCSLLVFLLAGTHVHAGDPEFLRGDADGDGRVVPMLDSYFMLDYAFSAGPVPPCFDAADVDGNDVFFALLDTLALLNWAFSDGVEPADPGPTTCGIDTGDSAGCATPPDPCPGDEPTIDVDTDYILTISEVDVADGDTEAVISVTLDVNGEDLVGYQFGVCNDVGVSVDDDNDIAEGTGLDDLDFTFHSARATTDGWTAAALSNVISLAVIEESTTPYELYDVTYQIDGSGTAILEFCDDASDQAIPPRVFTPGVEILPDTVNGSINIEEGDADYTLSISDETGALFGESVVSILLTNTGTALDGFQFGVCHDDLVDLGDTDDVAEGSALDGMDLTFQSISVYTGHWNVGTVFQIDEGETLAPGDDLELYLATYELLDEGSSILNFCADDLDPEVIAVVVKGEDLTPSRESGSIQISNPNGDFKRGDVDGDGLTFALVDAIYLLRWQFGDEDDPPCMDAADVNDNGSVFAIVDALYLLEYSFNDTEAPPDPGPSTCGPDPTDDDVDCLEIPLDCL